MYLGVAEDFETLTYTDPGIVSQPFGYKEPLRSRLKKGLTVAITGVFVVLFVVVAILHLPSLLIALAWEYWRSRRKAATTESVKEQPIKSDASSNIDESIERYEALGRIYNTRCRRRPVTRS